MISFRETLSEQKNTHMTHIEDKVLYGGVDGTRQAINALRSLRDMLKGEQDGNVSVKWDGAPAIFAGTDPSDGVFFVAKKGIFNKNPKIYKTAADVDNDTSGDLAVKLKSALRELPKLGIKGIIQGDFLFGPGDLKKKTIKGKKYVTFHPNTIVYAVPTDNDAARDIERATIGIVWHTSYSGNGFDSLRASYGVDVRGMKKSKSVWSQDAMLRDHTNILMTKKETDDVNKSLSQAGKLFNQIAGSTLRELQANQKLAQLIEQFNNKYVRKGQVVQNTRRHTDMLIKWIGLKFGKEEAKRKSDKGKQSQRDAKQQMLSFFSPRNKQNLIKMFELQKLIVVAKLKLINKLNTLQKVKSFVKTKNGFKVTGAEGYVAIDKLGGDAVKLVDRMEFSYNNFSPNILKGWDKPGRN
mgnify:FL=1|tara:strand:- start:1607 stop:2836 length:1230 start_codon:yes stop_codon:yes gene_type:complete